MRPTEFRVSLETPHTEEDAAELIADLIERAQELQPSITEDEWIAIVSADGFDVDGMGLVLIGIEDRDEWIERTAIAAGPAEEVETGPRPAGKNAVHAELLCSCQECEPRKSELAWFSPEETKKVKGDIMLYCPHSGTKYFTPAANLHEWLAGNTTKRGRRK